MVHKQAVSSGQHFETNTGCQSLVLVSNINANNIAFDGRFDRKQNQVLDALANTWQKACVQFWAELSELNNSVDISEPKLYDHTQNQLSRSKLPLDGRQM